MSKPKTIKIHLLSGEPGDIRVAHISNSTIEAIAFPAGKLAEVRKELPAIERPGIYILIGTHDDDETRPIAYIGESEIVGERLARHRASKNAGDAKAFWSDTVVFLSKDENLSKSHVRYAEACLIRATGGNARWSYPNLHLPSDDAGKLPRWERVDVEEFVEQAKVLVGVLGWDMFRQMQRRSLQAGEANELSLPLFHLRGEGFSAQMAYDPSGDFIVKLGSTARGRITPTIPASAVSLRAALVEKGVLRKEGDSLIFTSDYVFKSPSSAAAAVIGASANGRALWKLADGRTFADVEASQP